VCLFGFFVLCAVILIVSITIFICFLNIIF